MKKKQIGKSSREPKAKSQGHNPNDDSKDLNSLNGDDLYFAGRFLEAYQAYNRSLEIEIAQDRLKKPDSIKFYQKIGKCLLRLAKFSDAHKILTQAFEMQKDSQENDPLGFSNTLTLIGEAYFGELKLTDAENAFKEALDTIIKYFGEDHEGIVLCCNKLAVLYEFQEKYNEAVIYLERALKIGSLKEMQNDEVATAYVHMGGALRGRGNQEDYEKALDFINKGYEIKRKIYGEDHVETAWCYNVRGNLYLNQAKYQEALEQYQFVLKTRIHYLGEHHPKIGDIYQNLGVAYSYLEQNDQALESHMKSLKIREKCLPKNHPHLGFTFEFIGSIYSLQKNWTQSLKMLNKALGIYRKFYGQSHMNVDQCYARIENVYWHQGKFKKAEAILLKQLDIKVKNLGPNSLPVADNYQELGLCYHHLAQHKKSMASYLTSLKIHNYLKEKNYLGQAGCHFNSSLVHSDFKNLDSSISELERALKGYEKGFGKENEDYVSTYQRIETLQQEKCLRDNNYNFSL